MSRTHVAGADEAVDVLEPTVDQVAGMLDVLAAADVQMTITALEELLGRLRPAVTARARLARVAPVTLRAALLLRSARRSSCPRR